MPRRRRRGRNSHGTTSRRCCRLSRTGAGIAAAATALPQHRIKRTRTSGLWVAVGFFAVVMLLLLIFILQNTTQVSVSYLGLHGRLPLGVALLFAAVCGILLVVLAGAARISQLRGRGPAASEGRRQARRGDPTHRGARRSRPLGRPVK